MFVMMNTARLGVGLEGYAVAERAFQQAAEYARNRIQGKPPGVTLASAPIIHHPDVKRMLLTMKASIEAMRALTAYTAYQLDVNVCTGDEKVRSAMKLRGELLIPITKGWCTELGSEIASVGIQVHGGMGFIEETGAAQFLRDSRITSIYEGTTGIQANDLVGRKLGLDHGASMLALLTDAAAEIEAIRSSDSAMESMKRATLQALTLARKATEALLTSYANTPERALAVAVPYLKLCGFVLGGWLMTKSGVRARCKREGVKQQFYEGKFRTAQFYAAQILPNVHALAEIVTHGAESVVETSAELI
jgi:acyl-CoA dehydrogenase